jgi:hypothetical protein
VSNTVQVSESVTTALIGKGNAAINVASKAFSFNTQVGRGAGKVTYSGAKERAKIGVDKVTVKEINIADAYAITVAKQAAAEKSQKNRKGEKDDRDGAHKNVGPLVGAILEWLGF